MTDPHSIILLPISKAVYINGILNQQYAITEPGVESRRPGTAQLAGILRTDIPSSITYPYLVLQADSCESYNCERKLKLPASNFVPYLPLGYYEDTICDMSLLHDWRMVLSQINTTR